MSDGRIRIGLYVAELPFAENVEGDRVVSIVIIRRTCESAQIDSSLSFGVLFKNVVV